MITPKMYDIEVSSACQLSCKGCPINDNQAVKGFMDFEFFKSIVDRAKKETPDAVFVPWLNGEPLLHPNYFEMIKYLDESGFKYYITTNGMIWNEDLFRYILREGSNCYQIIFSLDGLPFKESKSIELARPGSNREKVIYTITKFGALKIEMSSKIDMAVKIVERGQDYAEIEEYIAYWLDKPYIDYVCKGKMLSGKTGGMRYKPCRYTDNQFMIITWDQHQTSCAYDPEMKNNRKYSFGKIDMTTPLMEYYNNPEITKFREDQKKGIYTEPCSECGYPYNGSGFDGTLTFKNSKFGNNTIYYHEDYYNHFYSYTLKQRKYKTETIKDKP